MSVRKVIAFGIAAGPISDETNPTLLASTWHSGVFIFHMPIPQFRHTPSMKLVLRTLAPTSPEVCVPWPAKLNRIKLSSMPSNKSQASAGDGTPLRSSIFGPADCGKLPTSNEAAPRKLPPGTWLTTEFAPVTKARKFGCSIIKPESAKPTKPQPPARSQAVSIFIADK